MSPSRLECRLGGATSKSLACSGGRVGRITFSASRPPLQNRKQERKIACQARAYRQSGSDLRRCLGSRAENGNNFVRRSGVGGLIAHAASGQEFCEGGEPAATGRERVCRKKREDNEVYSAVIGRVE